MYNYEVKYMQKSAMGMFNRLFDLYLKVDTCLHFCWVEPDDYITLKEN